ncbi:hypothetical protein SDC9_144162 [bioreactor metagenome]|uniref:HTH cro/C1-type domain-containing protein n=1 Tax=bioreactor metagenome TaxID=1076179 RepID=A0A645E603_9ZZZZ
MKIGIDYIQLGKRIAKRRRVLNLTQDDVAEATGLSNNYISNIENNHSIPSIETLMKLCSALKTTPDYFLLGIYKEFDENLLSGILQKMRLCSKQKLILADHFLTWLIDEQL